MLKTFLIFSSLLLPILGQNYTRPPSYTCPPNYTMVLNKCLQVFPTTAWGNHSAAEQIFRKDGGTLVTIRSAIENRAVATFAAGNNRIWIGTFCFGNDTSQCVYDDYSGPLSGYSGFERGYPLVTNHNDGCVLMVTQGSTAGNWLSSWCNPYEPVSPVCEVPPFVDYPIPTPACVNKYNGFCYTLWQGTYKNAEELCWSSFVSIHSNRENDYIQNNLFPPGQDQILIGAKRMYYMRYVWSDATNWDFDNRVPEDYNQNQLNLPDCLAMNRDTGLWSNIACNVSLPFYCKSPIPSNHPFESHCNSNSLLMAPLTITSDSYPYNNYGSLCSYKIGTTGAYRVKISIVHIWGVQLTIRDFDGNLIAQTGLQGTYVSPSSYISVTQTGTGGFRATVSAY
ncbi:unnamed protein product [Caenorhabditis brenneri]